MTTGSGTGGFTVIVAHIPKTGGTALRYHFAQHVDKSQMMAQGRHGRVRRFFDDKLQIEELEAGDFDDIRLLSGHGVDEMDVVNFRARPFRLLTVLRHPVDLMRSAYNHMRGVNQRRGVEIGSQAFLKTRPDNMMTMFLLNRFANFVDDPSAPLAEQIVSVLRKFDYVYTTERLGEQAAGLFSDLGFDTAMEHRRVAGDKATLEISDEEIRARNPIDLMLFERANQLVAEPGRHNAFGFDPQGRERVLEALAAGAGQTGDPNGYAPLAHALCFELRAEVALAKIDRGGVLAVRDRAAFRQILHSHWTAYREQLKPVQLEISAGKLAQWKTKRGKNR